MSTYFRFFQSPNTIRFKKRFENSTHKKTKQQTYASVFTNVGNEYADGALHFRHLHLTVDRTHCALEREREDVLAKHRVRRRHVQIAPVVVVVLHVDECRAELVVHDRVARLVQLRRKTHLHC